MMEALDFEKKKSDMRYGNQKHNQMLSEFATKQIQEAIERKCWNEGYGVIQVSPAYTSQIGRAARNGISELNRNAVLQSVQR